jgi:hypothetical protein
MGKKTICVMAWSVVFAAFGQQCTNVLQVLNTPLAPETMSQITASDHSTPDCLFLSFLKSSAQGDLSAFLSLFDDTYLASEFGVVDTNAFSSEDALDFQQFMTASSVTNRMLVSYSCTISGNVATVTARMNAGTANRSVDEDVEMTFIHANGEWKISRWQGE